MAASNELQSRLSALLREDPMPLEAFQDWFSLYVWNIHKREDLATQRVAYYVGLKFAEYTNGDLTQDSLREALAAAIRPSSLIKVRWVESGSEHAQKFVATSSGNSTHPPEAGAYRKPRSANESFPVQAVGAM